MRKLWFANCMLAAALGCTSTKGPGATGGFTSTGGAPGAPGAVVSAEPVGWTDKFVASMKEYSPDMFGDKKAAKAAPAPSTDAPFDPKSATPELHVALAQMSHRNGQVVQARQHYQKATPSSAPPGWKIAKVVSTSLRCCTSAPPRRIRRARPLRTT
jgi:hypothetical protein